MNQPKDLSSQLGEEERKKVAVNYFLCFNTPAGQAVLEDLKEMYQDKSSVVANDPHGTYFQEGCRFVYLILTETVNLGEKLKSEGE